MLLATQKHISIPTKHYSFIIGLIEAHHGSFLNAVKRITYLIPSMLIFGVAAQPVKAGCSSRAVQLWSIDVTTGRNTFLGKGKQSSCGNTHSRFEFVTLPQLRIGWAKGFSTCDKGVTPNETSVKINGIRIDGSVALLSEDITCVSQRQKSFLYCWK